VSLRVRTLSTLHLALFRASGGRVGRRLAGMPVLLLTTAGRTTGRARTVPLTYFEDADSLVVVGSYGGRPRNPAWFDNLLAAGEAEVTVGRHRRRVRARQATPEERARLWPRVVATYDGYRRYQEKTNREIPLAVLSRDRPQPSG
jgi:deazaflavin-dependent oxidoreductase (nitroreductase family)